MHDHVSAAPPSEKRRTWLPWAGRPRLSPARGRARARRRAGELCRAGEPPRQPRPRGGAHGAPGREIQAGAGKRRKKRRARRGATRPRGRRARGDAQREPAGLRLRLEPRRERRRRVRPEGSHEGGDARRQGRRAGALARAAAGVEGEIVEIVDRGAEARRRGPAPPRAERVARARRHAHPRAHPAPRRPRRGRPGREQRQGRRRGDRRRSRAGPSSPTRRPWGSSRRCSARRASCASRSRRSS